MFYAIKTFNLNISFNKSLSVQMYVIFFILFQTKSSSEQKPKLETESNYHEESPVKKDILSSETVTQKDTDVMNNKESIQSQDPGTDICDQVTNLKIDSQETTSIETESRKSLETNTMLTEESSHLDFAQKTEESDQEEKDISEDKTGQTEVLST